MKKTLSSTVFLSALFIVLLNFSFAQGSLADFEKIGLWKVDKANHRCLVDPAVWKRFPFDKKEQLLSLIYSEEKTWWEFYDMYSGKLLGKVGAFGPKIYP